MALPGKAALAMWWDMAPGMRAEFEDGHSHEHFPERLAIRVSPRDVLECRRRRRGRLPDVRTGGARDALVRALPAAAERNDPLVHAHDAPTIATWSAASAAGPIT
jgi:hypothetical protein